MTAGRASRPRKRSTGRLHRVVALVLDTVVPFDLAVPCQVFGWGRPDVGALRYEFSLCGVRKGEVATPQGFRISVSAGLKALRRADTIVVPGTSDLDRAIPKAVTKELRLAHDRGVRVLAICSGAFVLAEAGLLDGRRATTHWQDAPLLAERYPAVKVDPAVLFVDEGRVLTSAGIAAGIDLCLHVVLADHGAAVARAVAKRMVVPQFRSGGQAQFIDAPVPAPKESPLEATRAWLLADITRTRTIDEMAAHAIMSPRHFSRRFRQESGITPFQWLIRQRVLRARELLERTDLQVKQVAVRSGFGSTAAFRERFGREVGVSPASYRAAFRAPGRAGRGMAETRA